MLRGIDVSNWQGAINLAPLSVDFVIVKATEGTGFVDSYCDATIQQSIKLGLPWGFYHFGGYSTPTAEADFFIENCSNYFGHGIPVLDWEQDQSAEWVNEFVRYVHSKTGVWCWIYANPWRFNQGGVESNCGRWIASYPDVLRPSLNYDPGDPPATDGLICCWQFASDGSVEGYDGNLDVNIFYGDSDAWMAYAKATDEPVKPDVSILENDDYIVEIVKKNK